MAETHHLEHRNGVWYYRRRVPSHLVGIIGKAVIRYSLRTSDKREAIRLRAIHDVKNDAHFAQFEDQADQTTDLPKNDIPGPKFDGQVSLRALQKYVRRAVSADEAMLEGELQNDPPQTTEEDEYMRRDAELFLQILQDPTDERKSQLRANFQKRILKEAQLNADNVGADVQTAFDALTHRALLEIARRKIARLNDDFSKSAFDELFAVERIEGTPIAALARDFIIEKEEDYELNNVSPKRRDKLRGQVNSIVEILGAETLASDVEDQHVQHVRSILAKLPKNRMKIYGDLPIAQVLERAKKEGKQTLSPTTQQGYLDAFRELMHLAVRRKLVPHNPAEKVKPLKRIQPSANERREPFSLEQIISFFTSDFYRRCAPKANDPYKKPDREWRFWLPLIMLYSGARPNEICQLRASDIKQTTNGTWYFDLLTEEIRVKTRSSRRRVPVHDELIKCGLLAHAKARVADVTSSQFLLSGLNADKYGNRAAYACRRLNEAYLPEAIDMLERQSLYSLRHSFRDAMRRASAPPDALRAIGGWASSAKQVSDDYGDATNPDLYIDWMKAIEYPGLELSFLYR